MKYYHADSNHYVCETYYRKNDDNSVEVWYRYDHTRPWKYLSGYEAENIFEHDLDGGQAQEIGVGDFFKEII